jgi:AcrR family transcriptional regulator
VSKNAKPVATRMPRADAQRNRIRLLEAAKTLFAEKGPRASLDEIARTAGVGTGTFYRHFPTRDALIAAVYRNETERLVAAAECLGRSQPPLTALREWLLLFVDFIATKHGMHEVLDTFVGGASNLYSTSSTHVRLAIETLVDRGVSEGVIFCDLDPVSLLHALAGVANVGSGAEGERAAKCLVDIVITGITASHQKSLPAQSTSGVRELPRRRRRSPTRSQ